MIVFCTYETYVKFLQKVYFLFPDDFVPKTRDNKMAEFPTNERPGSKIAIVFGGRMSQTDLTKSSGSGTRTCNRQGMFVRLLYSYNIYWQLLRFLIPVTEIYPT